MGFADKIRAFFKKGSLGDEDFDDLADLLVEGDLGASFAYEVVDQLKSRCRKERILDLDGAKNLLAGLLSPYAVQKKLFLQPDVLNIVVILGVNGVGKTTSCAKLANWARTKGMEEIILAAGDTFRAAAVNQLKIHGQRLGIRVVAQHQGADSAAVLWDSIEAAESSGSNLVIADTAGRMHTRADLVKELAKIDKIITQKSPRANYVKLLVLDATTGQNGMRQAEIFNEAVKLNGVILTKYDSTAKGGMVLSLAKSYNLATLFIGTGEGYGDFLEFSPSNFLADFLGK
ncbi:MAG: fused signal recognition particle receptor [Spirochaetes bacterium]|nr:MAG: fused signal recognition particle receptor [Spirochaetota bacterium]